MKVPVAMSIGDSPENRKKNMESVLETLGAGPGNGHSIYPTSNAPHLLGNAVYLLCPGGDQNGLANA